MKPRAIKSIVYAVILSVTSTAMMQARAEAMLVPANVAQTGQDVNRSADLQTIQRTLESKVLRGKLHALGLSDAEIQSRISRLSDSQRHQLASQIRAVNPAGELLIGILVFVVLVLLIIFLIKRI